ncbi:hypothetical protein V1514DRAFT_346026 [Lipomyces japonicus]|uniref:uncharacterized protein n=1 Tax=Lipomyces japonicus TaxID=56871 RepID=UPI0034CF605B
MVTTNVKDTQLPGVNDYNTASPILADPTTTATSLDPFQSNAVLSTQFVPGNFNQAPAQPLGVTIPHDQTPAQTPGFEYGSSHINPYATQAHDMFYQPQAHYQPLQYHLYAPLPPHPINHQPYQKNVHSFFISDNLREELQRKAEASLQVLPSSNLPEYVSEYYSLVPLDTSLEKNNRVFGYTTSVYKAFFEKDNLPYAIRRLEGFKLNDEKAIGIVQQWKRVSNSNIVSLYEAFTTRQFGDNSIVFVYDYHPMSSTLFDVHFGPNARYVTSRTGPAVPEQVLWSYLVQISSALKSVHAANLAARVIDLTKIILTSKMRLRLNCVAVMDVIEGSADFKARADSLVSNQAKDLFDLGRLILSIASNNSTVSTGAVNNIAIGRTLEIVGRQYSSSLVNILIYLLNVRLPDPYEASGAPSQIVDELLLKLSPYLQQNFNSSLYYQDKIEKELMGELENARLVRLLCKFGFINERPEFDHDSSWSETGDRYLLKLFRDYVFHQVDEKGNPVVDLGHVLRCLNKLDAGVDEKILLVSRDEQSCLVVSYKELKNCVEAVFRDLSKATS